LNSLGGDIFCTCPDQPGDPPSLLYSAYKFSFPWLKQLEHDIDRPSPSSAEVKERVDLYLQSPPGLYALFGGEVYLFPFWII